MTGFWKLALCAGAIVSAGQAQAASFVEYKVTARGIGERLDQSPSGGGVTRTPYSLMFYTFIVPLAGTTVTTSPATASFFTVPSGFFPGFSNTATLDIRGTSFSLKASAQDDGTRAGGSFSVSACLLQSITTALPTGLIPFDPSCSTAEFNQNLGPRSRTSFSGTLIAVQGSSFEAASSPVGLVSAIPVLPEPATWAMMLTGFALTGYALRRRRARVVYV